MDWRPATLIGLGLVAATSLVGLVLRRRTGRVRDTAPAGAPASGIRSTKPEPTAAELLDLDADVLGDRATLVQFSTEYCAQCPGVARRLGELAGDYDGVRHVEIDLTRRAELADRFKVLQTPTTLILGADGAQLARIGGVPRFADVRARLDDLTGSLHVAS